MPIFFTFHYVSILIRDAPQRAEYSMIFTFHYVSILILGLFSRFCHTGNFTFHYVSILIYIRIGSCPFLFSLYIPLCLYFNLSCNDSCVHPVSSFTFHYVSILICCCELGRCSHFPLHSIMSLF